MQTQRVALAELRPHPANYNEHDDAQLTELQESLARFGQYKNIVIRNGEILAGHGLAEAAKRAGQTHIEVVDMSHLSEEDALALLAADNEIARKGKTDAAKLSALVERVKSGGKTVPGVSDSDLERILKNAKPKAPRRKKGKGKPGDRDVVPFKLDDEQAEVVERALALARSTNPLLSPPEGIVDAAKGRGDALAHVCEMYLMLMEAREG